MGKRFIVKNGELRLPNGDYEVVNESKKGIKTIGHLVFSDTIVKNLQTNKKYSIPTGNAQLIFGI